jgi:hypothetical protein
MRKIRVMLKKDGLNWRQMTPKERLAKHKKRWNKKKRITLQQLESKENTYLLAWINSQIQDASLLQEETSLQEEALFQVWIQEHCRNSVKKKCQKKFGKNHQRSVNKRSRSKMLCC